MGLLDIGRGFGGCLSLLVLFLTLSGELGHYHRYFEQSAHFKLQYLAGSIVCITLLLLVRASSKWLWTCALSLVLNLIYVLPWFVLAPGSVITPNEVRLLLVNVYTANRQFDKTLALFERESPDLIVMQEIDDAWLAAVNDIQAQYPYNLIIPREDNFGIAVFSRLPVTNMVEISLGDAGVPSIHAELIPGESRLTVVATHPLPPVSESYFESRNEQLQALGAHMARIDGSGIVLGDLNVSMWSPVYDDLMEASGLRNARDGFGVLPTWPTFFPWLMIPIDHCLHNIGVAIRDIRTGPDIGSDHLPLIVDIYVP